MRYFNIIPPGSPVEDQRAGVVLSRTGSQELPLDHGLVEELPVGSGETLRRASCHLWYWIQNTESTNIQTGDRVFLKKKGKVRALEEHPDSAVLWNLT